MVPMQKKSKKPSPNRFFWMGTIIVALLILVLVLLFKPLPEQKTPQELTPSKIKKTQSVKDQNNKEEEKKTKIEYPDDLDYNTAATQNTIQAYQNYIKQKPSGKYVTEATDNIKQLEAMPEDVRAMASQTSKVIRIYKNGKGFWEAEFMKGIIMVYIPQGKFIMGSDDYDDNEKPPHEVELDGYWIGKYEVTFNQYDMYCDETQNERADDAGWGRGNLPVIDVSWIDADAYCKWLSTMLNLNFKLPTEAQWEKAARGSENFPYPWGHQKPTLELSNYSNKKRTTPVGSYPEGQSPYGLMDMAGNLWEWCDDWFGNYDSTKSKNPLGPNSGTLRVLRGGSWFDIPLFLRCAGRFFGKPSYCGYVVGFRLCLKN